MIGPRLTLGLIYACPWRVLHHLPPFALAAEIICLLVEYQQTGVVMSTRRRPLPAEPLLRGALFTLRRRCGKATCHCAQGDPHESPALARYTSAKAQLDAAAETELMALRARRAGGRSTR